MTPNDTQRHFSGPNLGLLGLFGARNCAIQPVRTVPKHPVRPEVRAGVRKFGSGARDGACSETWRSRSVAGLVKAA